MMLAAFMRATAAGHAPPGDVILCLMVDEEAGSDEGASFLVAEHPELFAGVRYALGGPMGGLGRLLHRLDRRRLPVHVTPVARSMVEAIAEEIPPALALPLRGL